MYAVSAARISPETPLDALSLGRRPEPIAPRPDWTVVTVKAASLNHHDLWTLRGVGILPERLPIILGCDGSAVDENGEPVIIHAVIGETGHGLGPGDSKSFLTEIHDGTFAERIAVPRWNLLPKPDFLTFAEAACLSSTYLTAYRMLFTRAEIRPGGTVLVQGAGGGVATAAIALAAAAGYRVWATSRDTRKRKRALALGADAAFAPGEQLPHEVDAVVETVGNATWTQSVRALKPGGSLVVSGATTGDPSEFGLDLIRRRGLRVLGSTIGTRDELSQLIEFCRITGVRPLIDTVYPLDQARHGFERMARGDLFGKVVFETCDAAGAGSAARP